MSMKVEDSEKKLKSLVEKSNFFKEHPPRVLPCFDKNEITVNKILGVGGFCNVYEILSMDITPKTNGQGDSPDSRSDDFVDEELELEDFFDEQLDEHDNFKDMEKMKHYMAENCFRQDDARYALKRLRNDLTEKEKHYGTLDLAIEAKFLASIIHPNIVKMRGTASGKSLQSGFFLVLDRLYDTLETRIDVWREKLRNSKGCCGFGGQKDQLNDLMLERMTVSYDLSSAFLFLHQKGLIYRDIKTENIGFDVRGDVKVFDFGLCKELKSSEKCKKTKLYRMTGKTGSVRYMSPEVAKCEPYDQRADIYSFGILLWEIFSCQEAFASFAIPDYKQVIHQGYRPPIVSSNFTVHTNNLVQQCWSADMKKRPDFSRIASILRGEMRDLSDAKEITNRTNHMLSRSKASGHLRITNLSKASDGSSLGLSSSRHHRIQSISKDTATNGAGSVTGISPTHDGFRTRYSSEILEQ